MGTTSGRQARWMLERHTEADDFTGAPEVVEELEEVYLRVDSSSSRELSRAQQVNPLVTHMVTCHYRPAITPDLRFRKGGRVLSIDGVSNVREENRELRITAVESLRSE